MKAMKKSKSNACRRFVPADCIGQHALTYAGIKNDAEKTLKPDKVTVRHMYIAPAVWLKLLSDLE